MEISSILPGFLTPVIFAVLLLATHFLNRASGEPHKWALYYTILASVLVSYAAYSSRTIDSLSRRISESARACFIAFIFAVCLLIQPGSLSVFALLMGVIFCSLVVFYFNKAQREGIAPAQYVLFCLMSCIGWKLSSRFVWWSPDFLKETVKTNLLTLSFLSVFIYYTLVEKFFLRSPPHNRVLNRVITGISLISFFALCGRPYAIEDSLLHHQSFFVGPIELLKQGGILLWDIPSQYGLLNIFIASKINLGSTWQSFLIINKFFILSSAVLLYFFLRQVFVTVFGNILSMLLTVSCIFCWPGWIPELSGPFAYPSVGAFRFIWCYALASYGYYLTLASTRSNPHARMFRCICGNFLWLIAVFWSIESAVYSTLFWLTFNFVWFYQENKGADLFSIFKAIAGVCKVLLYPLIAIVLISGAYYFKLGHFPDWRNYIEYALAYKGGFGALPVDSHGAVWGLLALFMLGTVVLLVALRSDSKYGPFMAGSLALFWAVSSYFVSRSHENNTSNLMPLIILFIGSMMITIANMNVKRGFIFAPIFLLAPLFVIVVAAPLTHEKLWTLIGKTDEIDYLGEKLKGQSVSQASELIQVKKALGISPLERSAFLGEVLEVLPDTERQPEYWLPLAPSGELVILKPARIQVYIDRFSARKQEGGWLFRLKANSDGDGPILAQIRKTFSLAETKTAGNWVAERFEYKPQ